MKRVCTLAALLCAVSCGSNTATPTASTSTTTFTLSGVITSATTGTAISAATVAISGGTSSGQSTASDSGRNYSLAGLSTSSFTLNVTATNFSPSSQSVTLTASQTLNVGLSPTALFSMSGLGNSVFTMPGTVSHVHIIGTYPGPNASFIVTIGGTLLVNAAIGSEAAPAVSDGVYATTGGTVAITNSAGVSWSFNEVR
jgi:hypothetical protein